MTPDQIKPVGVNQVLCSAEFQSKHGVVSICRRLHGHSGSHIGDAKSEVRMTPDPLLEALKEAAKKATKGQWELFGLLACNSISTLIGRIEKAERVVEIAKRLISARQSKHNFELLVAALREYEAGRGE